MKIEKSARQGGQSGGLPEISRGYHPRLEAHKNIRPGRGEGRRSKIASVSGALSGRMIYLVRIPGVIPPANFHQPAGLKNSNHLKPFTGSYSHLQTPLPPGGIFWPAKSKILMLPHFSCHALSRQITPCHALSRVFCRIKDCLFL
jgi:hypothetical protein